MYAYTSSCNVFCVVTKHNKDQDTRARHKTTNYRYVLAEFFFSSDWLFPNETIAFQF